MITLFVHHEPFTLTLPLQQLRHENLISLLDVFHRKKRLYLVFEFMDRTVLDDMEKHPEGLKSSYVRQVIWQVLKGVEFIHNHEVGVARWMGGCGRIQCPHGWPWIAIHDSHCADQH